VVSEPRRGDVWWGEAPDQKGRPYLVLTRDEAIPVLRTILVAPVTRTVRGIPTEVPLGAAEGLPVDSVASCDNLLTFPKSMLIRRMGALGSDRMLDMCGAARVAIDC
jgi:mRNA interferase MazF